MTSSPSYEDVIADLRQLKLSTMRQTLDDHLRLAQSKSLTYLEFLKGLTSEEIKGREASAYRRRLKSSRFPVTKTSRSSSLRFSRAWRREDPAAKRLPLGGQCREPDLCRPVGTGKSHLGIALSLVALQRGYRVYFTTVADLLDQVNIATANGQLAGFQKRLFKNDVIILTNWVT